MRATSCVLTLTLLVSLTTSAPTQTPPSSGGATRVSMTTSPVAPSGIFTSTPPSAPPSVSTSGGSSSVSRSYSSETTVPDTPVSSGNILSPSGVNDVETIVISFGGSTSGQGSSPTNSLTGGPGVNANSTSVTMTTTTPGSMAQSPTTEVNSAGDYVPFTIPVEIGLIDENLLDSPSKTVL